MSPLFVTLIVVLILAAFGGFAFFLLRQSSPEQNRARQIITGKGSDSKKTGQVDLADRRRASLAKKLKNQDDDGGKKKKNNTLRDRLQQTGRDISTRQYFTYSGISGVVLVVMALLLKASPVLMIFMAIIGFFGLPRFVIGRMATRRQKKFLEEFADALEAMTRLLKSGMPVAEAIAMVSREYTGPIGEEMSKIYDSQRIGIPLHEAALEAAVRIPLPEVKMFATGLAIQAQTGSSLSEILTNLADVIRARYKLARKVKALSSEAKASAGIIGALPVVVGGGMYFLKPEHVMVLVETPMGKVMLAFALVWMSLGVLSMKLMINFKV
ncbi:MAG: type II secretion system F family protein [Rhodospirillales bacterium]|nr:type II secretion system F family protein [Rhodospirillales bacterium]